MSQNYPETYAHTTRMLERLHGELPGVMDGFTRLVEEASAPGALDRKTKELIALSIAITVRCNGCISYHVHDALEAGAGKQELLETIGMSILMGGGPSLIYGIEAYEAIEQFQEAGVG